MLFADGTAIVQTDMTDIGTGTYTILTQVAADGLGLPPGRVRVELWRSEYPVSMGSGGSWGAANSSTAVHRACQALRKKPVATARNDVGSALHGLDPAGAKFSDGSVSIDGVSEGLSEIVARNYPAVGGRVTDPGDLSAQHRVLVPQDQQFSILAQVSPHQHSGQNRADAHQLIQDRQQQHPMMIHPGQHSEDPRSECCVKFLSPAGCPE